LRYQVYTNAYQNLDVIIKFHNCRKMHSGIMAMRWSARLRRAPGRIQLCGKLREQRVSMPDGEVVHPASVALQRNCRLR